MKRGHEVTDLTALCPPKRARAPAPVLCDYYTQTGKTISGHSEEAAVHTPGSVRSPGTAFSGTWIMGFRWPELGENQCPLLKPALPCPATPWSVALCYGHPSRHLARFLIVLFAFLIVDFKDLLIYLGRK